MKEIEKFCQTSSKTAVQCFISSLESFNFEVEEEIKVARSIYFKRFGK